MKAINQLSKVVFVLFLFGATTNGNAQFWKKLAKKIEKKLERKAEDRIDRETDKAIDKTIDGVLDGKKDKKKPKQKKAREVKETREVTNTLTSNDNREKDYGDFQINYSVKFGTKTILVLQLQQAKVVHYLNEEYIKKFYGL